jgi:4-carboxymuconolactone decarboxylase
MTDSLDVFNQGVANRNAVMGETHVARSTAARDEFSAPLTDVAMRFCWGELWSRDGLPWKTRSLVVLGMLAALDRPNEFKAHVGGALRNGATKEEIQEVLLQVVVYCGLPAGSQAFKLAKEYFAENPDVGPAPTP